MKFTRGRKVNDLLGGGCVHISAPITVPFLGQCGSDLVN